MLNATSWPQRATLPQTQHGFVPASTVAGRRGTHLVRRARVETDLADVLRALDGVQGVRRGLAAINEVRVEYLRAAAAGVTRARRQRLGRRPRTLNLYPCTTFGGGLSWS